uniref:Cytoglobin1like [Saccoglossus kowalevskii] n=1 Tax=Lepeophtheirus salmonis TaxID=72036 RepID=A0A0K2TPZ2_LEPSM
MVTMSLFSEHEVKLISESWKLMALDLDNHGLNFFLKLFKEYPVYEEKFFPDINGDRKKLKRHGGIVMKAIGKLIGFLETGKIIAIVNTIKGIANGHSKRGVLVQQFTVSSQEYCIERFHVTLALLM